MIAGWVQHLGWTKSPAGSQKQPAPITQTAPEAVAPKAPAAPSLDPEQVHQMALDIAAVREAVERHLPDVRATVEQLAASQDQMMREVDRLQATDEEILAKIPVPPPKRPAAPARKPTTIAPSPSRTPLPPPHP